MPALCLKLRLKNKLSNVKVDQTGGHALSAACGVEFNFSKIAVGFNVQAPLEQNFAAGQTELKVRGMAHVTFAL